MASRRLRVRMMAVNGDWSEMSFSAHQLAEACHVESRTAYRWIRNEELPPMAEELVQYKLMGKVNREAECQLAAAVYVAAERDELRRTVGKLEDRIDLLEAGIEHWRSIAGAPRAANEERPDAAEMLRPS